MKIINFKTKKMRLLTKEQQGSYENAQICYICKEKFESKYLKDKKYCNVKDHCHYTGEYRDAGHTICNLKYSVSKKIAKLVMDLVMSYQKNFKKTLPVQEKKTEKYVSFTVSIEKEVTKTDNNGEEITKNISYVLKCIDSARFMASSLLNLLNNLFEGLYRIKCKLKHDDKKCETCRIKYKYCDCFLEYTNFKDDLIEYKCCSKSYQRKLDENLKERFFNVCKLCNHNNNKFILLC